MLLAAVLASCGGATERRAAEPVDSQTWQQALGQLQELRETWAPRDEVFSVKGSFRDLRSGKTWSARGAVATSASMHAVRMILTGPGGGTVMDFWARGGRWRIALPPRDTVLRGDASSLPSAEERLPVGFLRWWFIEPLEGELLSVHSKDAARVLVLRHRDSVVQVQPRPDGGLQMWRRDGGQDETLLVSRPGCGEARYRHEQAGFEVVLRCDDADGARKAPSKAFEEP